MTAAEFAAFAQQLRQAGATFIGGCCGTTPDFIRALARQSGNKPT
jgi:methionine synthase I (cobalamin-dependent)